MGGRRGEREGVCRGDSLGEYNGEREGVVWAREKA